MSKKIYKYLDLFAGAGGFSVGLHAAGFSSVGAVEIDPAAGSTYKDNFPDCILHHSGPDDGDIRTLPPQRIVQTLVGNGIDELDLLVAGPPCQGFSRVGRGKLSSLAEKHQAFICDPRNRLYIHAIEYLAILRPRVLLFENVAGILHLGGHNMAEVVCEEVARLGYTVRCALLNSAWYGVPQTRERVFILAFRNDLALRPVFPSIKYNVQLSRGHLSDAELDPRNWHNQEYFVGYEQLTIVPELRDAVTTCQAFADLPPFRRHLDDEKYRAKRDLSINYEYPGPPPNGYCRLMRDWHGLFKSALITDHFCRYTPRDYRIFKKMKPGDRYPDAVEIAVNLYESTKLRAMRRGEKPPRRRDFVPPYSLTGFPDKWRKLLPDMPSWTITAHLGKDTYSHIHYDSNQARAITVREAARLQSFPDGFKFRGNMGEVFHQIGNAVPPLLAHEMGTSIYQQLQSVSET